MGDDNAWVFLKGTGSQINPPNPVFAVEPEESYLLVKKMPHYF